MVIDDNFLMQKALEEAWKFQGLTFPNPAVGALVTDANNQIISIAAHQQAGQSHAEVNAIKQAYFKLTNDTQINKLTNPSEIHEYLYQNHNGIFKDKKIYVTLEPCNHFGKTPPCALLISNLGFQEVLIGVQDSNQEASGGIQRLQENGLHVKTGIMQKECEKLLEPFSTWQQKPFVFFKLALSKNSVIEGGTITSKASREHVHALRDKCDLLVIGGNTVRIDRPTLDARLVDGKAPDILIYSKQKEFDETIPLFGIKNRKVFIEDNLEKIKEYKFVMVEGGVGMLQALKSQIDWYLFYRSPHIKEGRSIEIAIDLEEQFSMSVGEDTLTWYTKRG